MACKHHEPAARPIERIDLLARDPTQRQARFDSPQNRKRLSGEMRNARLFANPGTTATSASAPTPTKIGIRRWNEPPRLRNATIRFGRPGLVRGIAHGSSRWAPLRAPEAVRRSFLRRGFVGLLVEPDHVPARIAQPRRDFGGVGADRLDELGAIGAPPPAPRPPRCPPSHRRDPGGLPPAKRRACGRPRDR